MKTPRTGIPKATVLQPETPNVGNESRAAFTGQSDRSERATTGAFKRAANIALDGYLGFLNTEAAEGTAAAQTLVEAGVGSRHSLFDAHPAWTRLGTFEAVLLLARDAFDSDPRMALELTTFVLSYVDRLEPPADNLGFLVQRLHGNAWKEHGNALYMLDHFDEALTAADRALAIFSADPFHVVDRMRAQALRALILHALSRHSEAAQCLDGAPELLAEHHEISGYLAVLQVAALSALKQGAYADAREGFTAALRVAEERGDEREATRCFQNLGICAMHLGELSTAQQCLTKAVVGFFRLRLDSELRRALWATAKVEVDRGNLGGALDTLHAAYGWFLGHGMAVEATKVCVMIGDVVTELTSDSTYAKSMCNKLVVTLGRYDVPERVRQAMTELRTATATARSLEGLRAALARGVAWLTAFCDGGWSATESIPIIIGDSRRGEPT